MGFWLGTSFLMLMLMVVENENTQYDLIVSPVTSVFLLYTDTHLRSARVKAVFTICLQSNSTGTRYIQSKYTYHTYAIKDSFGR
jgi:hypothetical protein